MDNMPIYNALLKYVKSKKVHFDVPGHKRNPKTELLKDFFNHKLIELDASSAKPLDMIGTPTGVIKEASQLMAKAFLSEDAFLMVNGTTAGVQNMIMSVLKPGDKIILPRNVHKSAINALILSGAMPVYVEPVIDDKLGIAHGVTVDGVKNAINNNLDAKAVLIINPTYYGATSDLKEIISLTRLHNMIFLCDEAHGSHFYFNDSLPLGAMSVGADMSAVSLHKTGGSLTQSSVLLAHRRHIDTHIIQRTIELTQTTSPSYLLLSSLDVAREVLINSGKELLDEAIELSEYARNKINNIGDYYVLGRELIGQPGIFDLDLTKLSIKVSDIGLTGIEVYDILRDSYNIQVELGDIHTIMAIVSIGDTRINMDILIDALIDIRKIYKIDKVIKTDFLWSRPHMVVTPREAYYANKKSVPLSSSIGEIAGESVMAYPPGIPIVAPGEKITKEVLEYIDFLQKQDCVLTGTDDPKLETILILGS
ncbi:MAG: aminotransferase class I/II-fold pyridoxal phosphate-dependent enzyme [Firmicutes bacterium]|nr:aminotransferase class I/II-fold pyridoxal phosphate-dependent enzyme [Bacillota bacterium]